MEYTTEFAHKVLQAIVDYGPPDHIECHWFLVFVFDRADESLPYEPSPRGLLQYCEEQQQ